MLVLTLKFSKVVLHFFIKQIDLCRTCFHAFSKEERILFSAIGTDDICQIPRFCMRSALNSVLCLTIQTIHINFLLKIGLCYLFYLFASNERINV